MQTSKRDRDVRRVLIIELVLNLLVAGAKGAYGLASGSLSIAADAVHSLVDAGSNIIGILVLHHSIQPPDPEHPYGHRKFEVIAASLLGLAVGAVGINLGVTIVQSFGERSAPSTSVIGLIVLLATLGINIVVASYEAKKGRELESRFLLADAAHTASDILVTGTVLLSFLGSYLGIPYADAVGASIVVLVILRVAWTIIRKNLSPLVDEALVGADTIAAIAMQVDGVLGCHKVRSRGLHDEFTIDLHLVLDGTVRLSEAHQVAHEVRRRICTKAPQADVTIQLEPERRKETRDFEGPEKRVDPYVCPQRGSADTTK